MAASDKSIVVIAHRGAHQRAPENTLPAYRAAIDLGADYVEIDIRTAKDGAFVCHHNSTVDARTNGVGRVSDLTLAEIRALDAGSWFDSSFAGTQVPTVDEAFELVRGRIGVYLDVKDASPENVVALLQRHDLVSSTVIYGDMDELLAMREIDPAVRPMPEYPGSRERTVALAEALRPDVIAISGADRMTQKAVDACHAVGAMAFVDIMDADDADGWTRAVEMGVDGLQTDRPVELVRFLREKSLKP